MIPAQVYSRILRQGAFLILFALPLLLQAQEKLSASKQQEKEKIIIQAKKAANIGKPDDARKLYMEALKIDKGCDACYYDLSNLYADASMFQRAYQMSGMAYRLDSLNSWYILQHARLAYFNKQFEESERLYSILLTKYPDKQEVWLSLASSYEEQGNSQRALVILDSMQARYGVNDDVLYRRYSIYLRSNELNKALEKAVELSENNPGDPRFYTLLADTYNMVGNDSLALTTYNEALMIDKTFAPAILGRAETFRKSGDFKQYFKSVQAYTANKNIDPKEKADYLSLLLDIPSFAQYFKADIDTLFAITSTIHPTSIPLKYLQASFFMSTDRISESMSLFQRIISMDSTNFSAWNRIITIEYGLGKWDDMNTMATRAAKIFPTHPNFQMYRAMASWQQENLKDAAKILESAVKKYPKDTNFLSQAHSLLGDIYYQNGKEKKAFSNYQSALKYNPNNAGVLNNYAYYLSLKNKNLDQAYSMSKKSLEIDGSNHIFLDTFAYILYLQGKYSEAKTMFRQAIASGGKDSAVILEHYADTLYKLGEYDTAGIYWSQALEREDCKNPEEIKKKLKMLK